MDISGIRVGEKYLLWRYGRLSRVVAARVGEKTVTLNSLSGWVEAAKADPSSLFPYSDEAFAEYLEIRKGREAADAALLAFIGRLGPARRPAPPSPPRSRA